MAREYLPFPVDLKVKGVYTVTSLYSEMFICACYVSTSFIVLYCSCFHSNIWSDNFLLK